MGWAQVTLLIGVLATAALLARALVGDRSRGRRRCPKCWYDLGATPGLVCPECGRDARRETRLFKSRRPKRWTVASLLPAIAGSAAYGVWLSRQPDWVQRLPTVALVATSPWLGRTDQMGHELLMRIAIARQDRVSSWSLDLSRRISAHMVRAGGDADGVLFHTALLLNGGHADETALAAVTRLTQSSDVPTVLNATIMLGNFDRSPKVEDALAALWAHPDPSVPRTVLTSLGRIRAKSPGGPAPEQMLAAAEDLGHLGWATRACGMLGDCDPSERSRAALLAAAEVPHPWTKISAVVSLSNLYPDDAGVRSRLLALLNDPTMADQRPMIVESVLRADARYVEPGGALAPARRELYTDEIRAEIVKTAAARGISWGWSATPAWLRTHPCFTAQERARVPAPTAGAEWSNDGK